MRAFAASVPALELRGRFYREVVRRILGAHFPRLSYAAALIRDGSQGLSLDAVLSTLLINIESDPADHRILVTTVRQVYG